MLRDAVSGTPRRAAPAERGLSAEVVAALPRTMVVHLAGDEEASTCTICFEPVLSNEEVFQLRCGHRCAVVRLGFAVFRILLG